MITPQNKATLNEYAEIKLKIKELEVQAETLNPLVLEMMQENELGEIDIGNLGKLSLSSRRTWIYPEAISSLEKDLKSKKKEAEQVGTASYTEKFFPMFKSNRE